MLSRDAGLAKFQQRVTTWAADIFGRFHEPHTRNLLWTAENALAEEASIARSRGKKRVNQIEWKCCPRMYTSPSHIMYPCNACTCIYIRDGFSTISRSVFQFFTVLLLPSSFFFVHHLCLPLRSSHLCRAK